MIVVGSSSGVSDHGAEHLREGVEVGVERASVSRLGPPLVDRGNAARAARAHGRTIATTYRASRLPGFLNCVGPAST